MAGTAGWDLTIREIQVPPPTTPRKLRWSLVRKRTLRPATDEPRPAGDTPAAKTERELRRTQAELLDVRRELQLTVDTIPALVATYQPDGTRGFVNRRWLEYTGRTLEDAHRLEGASGTLLVHPDQAEMAEKQWRKSVATGEPCLAEWRLRSADGTYRRHDVRRVPLRDEQGKVIKWYGVAFDVEDQKAAEDALRANEAYLAEAQTLSRTGSFGWHVPTGELFWSAETYRIFGYDPGAHVTLAMIVERTHPDDRAFVREVIDRAVAQKEAFDVEHRLQMPDGAVKHLHIVAHVITNGPENLQFAGAVMDITSHRLAEDELRRSEQRYRHLFHHMPVALWQLNASKLLDVFRQWRAQGITDIEPLFDADPNLVQRCMEMLVVDEVNEHTVKMLGGRDAKQFVGTTVADYFPRNSATFRRSMISRYRGELIYGAETKLQTLDGRTVDVLYTASRMGQTVEPGMSLLGITDISERKRTEAALHRSERRYESLFRAMAAAFFELDFAEIGGLLRELRSSGVTDLKQHFKENPATVRRFMEATRVLDVNDQSVVVFGLAGRDAIPDSVAPFWPDESIPAYADAILSSLEGKPSFQVETPMCRADGTTFEAHFTISYPADYPTRGIGGVIDITERKQAFQALEKSEQRYRHLFNYMPIPLQQLNSTRLGEMFRDLRAKGVTDLEAYFVANPEFERECMEALIVEEVNQRTVELLGVRDASALVGKPVGPSWRARPDTFRRVMASRFRGFPTFEEETQWSTRDGRTVDVLFTASRLEMAGDAGISLVGAMDISPRIKAFQALEKSEQRYRYLFHNMPVSLWQFDATGLLAKLSELRAQGVTDLSAYFDEHPDFLRTAVDSLTVQEVNDYTMRLFGARTAGELRGSTYWLWEKSPHTIRRSIESRWRGEEFFHETTKLMTRDGRVIDALFTAVRPLPVEGLPISLVSVIDITEQVRTQEELQRLRADFAHTARVSMLGELTASIAHEVNQPLAAIAAGGSASLRWLSRPAPNYHEIRELTTHMVADAQRASDIISRIRTMATRRIPEPRPLSLDDVIHEALLFLRHEAQSRDVSISHFPAAGRWKIVADRTQIQQVIVNLVVNAMQAITSDARGGRTISIRTALRTNSAVSCAIEDSGPGINPEHFARLFDSFFTTKDGGMGMGLRICRSVIEAHGGRIEVDNHSAHGGARFSFILPIDATAA